MTTTEVIETLSATIVDLDKLSVKGAENMALVLGCIQRLDVIRRQLQRPPKGEADVQNTAE